MAHIIDKSRNKTQRKNQNPRNVTGSLMQNQKFMPTRDSSGSLERKPQ